ncbi:hypothetical protein [Lysobacter sp. A03]|uniref:hypothetical protein n=1 Tax=Lysobacter sp. A03 TaxID=1199154 RepID=UPI0005B726C1|nr:hypothetical protein [Lysobacter sp. A03]KIQ96184.1 hypothetical protein TI01_2266 [Lysobacter sp. A03]
MDLATPPHTLLLPIDPDLWPPPSGPISVDGTVYAPKPELHVTLIGSRLGARLHTTFSKTFVHEEIAKAVAEQDWRFQRTGRLVQLAHTPAATGNASSQAPPRGSIIELIDLPAMRLFHQALAALLGRQLPVPPPHVTLYTAHGPRGIGLASPLQLRTRRLRELRPEEIHYLG